MFRTSFRGARDRLPAPAVMQAPSVAGRGLWKPGIRGRHAPCSPQAKDLLSPAPARGPAAADAVDPHMARSTLTSLRAGVIGTGFIGPVHIEALARLGVRVTAVCGSSRSAPAVAARWGIPE